MYAKPGTEVSYLLTSKKGMVVMAYDGRDEVLATKAAKKRGLVLLKRTTTSEEVKP